MINVETVQRRKDSRYEVDLTGDVMSTNQKGEKTRVPCKVVNVSRHGVCFETRKGLGKQGFLTKLRLALPNTTSPIFPIKVMGQRQTNTDSSRYSAEVSFPSETDRRKLHVFLSSLKNHHVIDRRRAERRQVVLPKVPEMRLKGRRKSYGIFAEAASFANRARIWKSEHALYRSTEATLPSRIVVNGRELISYGSNDYLGLSHHPKVKEAAIKAIERYGTCSGSRVLTGTLSLHEEFEHELAEFKGAETVLVFAGGYLTNVGILTTFLKEGDIAFIDEKAHASIIDGCIYSRAKLVPFRHNSARDLDAKIKRLNPSRSLIIVDGVYSLEGDVARLPEIKAIATAHNVPLMVDDAHGIGVVGTTGAGTAELFNLLGQIDLDMGTLSGAFGGVGGFVACKGYLADYMRRFSRGFCFTTSLPPATTAGLLEALRIIKADTSLRARLWSNVDRLKAGLRALEYQISNTESAIISILIGHEQTTWGVVRLLEDRGVYVSPFIRPAVKRGEARIRLTVNAMHTEQDIATTVDIFRSVKAEMETMIHSGSA